MSLARWFPGPVPLLVAGRPVRASQLRLRDLATLEAYVVARFRDPLDGIGPDDPGYADALRSAYEEHESGRWPPPPGSPDWVQATEHEVAGFRVFLELALRETPPRRRRKAIRAILAGEDDRAASDLLAIAWDAEDSTRDAILRAIDAFLGLPEFVARDRGTPGREVTWSQAIGELVCGSGEAPGLAWASPEAIGNLTLSQYRQVVTGGVERTEDPVPEDDALATQIEDARLAFFYPDGLEPDDVAEDDGGAAAEAPDREDWEIAAMAEAEALRAMEE